MFHGSFFVIVPRFWDYFNELPNQLFLFGEEAVLSHYVRMSGSIHFVPSLIVRHEEHSSIGKMESRAYFRLQQQSYQIYARYL